jgi:hypothetical protein
MQLSSRPLARRLDRRIPRRPPCPCNLRAARAAAILWWQRRAVRCARLARARATVCWKSTAGAWTIRSEWRPWRPRSRQRFAELDWRGSLHVGMGTPRRGARRPSSLCSGGPPRRLPETQCPHRGQRQDRDLRQRQNRARSPRVRRPCQPPRPPPNTSERSPSRALAPDARVVSLQRSQGSLARRRAV